jgi:hypothetical protein
MVLLTLLVLTAFLYCLIDNVNQYFFAAGSAAALSMIASLPSTRGAATSLVLGQLAIEIFGAIASVRVGGQRARTVACRIVEAACRRPVGIVGGQGV